MKTLQVLVGGIVYVGGILTIAAVAIYGLWWITLMVIRRVPMIGKRHRHASWDRLNRSSEPSARDPTVTDAARYVLRPLSAIDRHKALEVTNEKKDLGASHNPPRPVSHERSGESPEV